MREDHSVHDIVTKTRLRAELLGKRATMSSDVRSDAARSIRDALLSEPEIEMAGTVAAHVSLDSEPDTRGLLFALWKRGTYVLLPRLLPDGDLDWASYEGPDSLAPGPHGILEPTEPPRGPGAVASADVVLAPAVAVDRAGMRLGRGGGSYDRALARVGPAILTVAVLYDGELLPEVPAEPHDQRVRAVVTPSGGLLRLG
ncbi:5-formyltetrahydrofolate cyclo-ligase [Actinomadura litoris]|uniref:5-formyltetrahydrofolate cyclo-ligase n=1 Tax=Actinomadura litoris TaxID=2678616 RepID=UPI00234303E7|nr:5-formyltetrahydrofolate cyclo-ligase [Actinomadura litoris]